MIELLNEETNPNPRNILADSGKAELNALSKKFLQAEISYCYFQLTQSYYNEKLPEFNLALRLLPALAHVPPAHVKASFENFF